LHLEAIGETPPNNAENASNVACCDQPQVPSRAILAARAFESRFS